MDTPGLKKAMTTLDFLSQNKEARMLYEMRKKALLDEQSALHEAELRGKEAGREAGREEGREEGRDEGRTEVALNLLRKGLSVSLISEVTGLSAVEVEKLDVERKH